MFTSVKWAYTANWGEKGFSALFTFVLAAALGPRAFGVVSIAMIYIAFIQMFLDQGLVAALIQKKELQPEHLDGVFWMDLLLSFSLAGLSIVCSRWWAAFNHVPELSRIIAVLSLCIPIEGLAIVQKAMLQRDMDFKSLSLRSNLSVVAGGTLGIAMAYGGYGVWALVAQQVAKDLSALMLLWKLSGWRPRFTFSWKHFKELLGFSSSNFLAQLGTFVDIQAGATIVSAMFGPVAVGLYRLAERLMNTVLATTTSSIQSVSLPEFSRFQDHPPELRNSVLTCLRWGSAVAMPAMAGLAVVSDPLIAIMGPQWAPAADVLKILSLLATILMLAFFTGPLLQALSRPRFLAGLEWGRTAVDVALLLTASLLVRTMSIRGQIIGIAVARFAGVLLIAPVFIYILLRACGLSLRELARAIAPSLLSSVVVVGSVLLFRSSGLLAGSRPSLLLAGEVLVGGISGAAVLLALDSQLRRIFTGLLGLETTNAPAVKERIAYEDLGHSTHL